MADVPEYDRTRTDSSRFYTNTHDKYDSVSSIFRTVKGLIFVIAFFLQLIVLDILLHLS